MDLKVLIISFVRVETNCGGWFAHEMGRLSKNFYCLKNDSFYKETFGYSKHDLARKPFYLFNNLHIIDDFYPTHDQEKANVEFIKILVKFTDYIDFNFGKNLNFFENYLQYIQKAKLKHLFLRLKKNEIERVQKLNLSQVKVLDLLILPYDLDNVLTIPELPNVHSLLITYQSIQIISEKTANYCLNFISKLHLKNFYSHKFDDIQFALSILETQNHKMNFVQIEDIISDQKSLDFIIQRDIETLELYCLNSILDGPLKFHSSIHSLIIGLAETFFQNNIPIDINSLLKNITDLANIQYLEIRSKQKPLENVLENFLKLCDEKGIELKTTIPITNKKKQKYKNIYFS